MTYLAVPVAALLAGLDPPANTVIESVALDGFAAQLPLDLLTNTDPAKAVAWLAIEPDDPRWPMLPGKAESAGPFYIVWTGASVATDPQRAMAVPVEAAREPIVAAGALARARCRSGIVRDGPGARRPCAVQDAMPALPYPERRRHRHHGAGLESADESDPVHDAGRAARPDPRSRNRFAVGPPCKCPALRRTR